VPNGTVAKTRSPKDQERFVRTVPRDSGSLGLTRSGATVSVGSYVSGYAWRGCRRPVSLEPASALKRR